MIRGPDEDELVPEGYWERIAAWIATLRPREDEPDDLPPVEPIS